MAVGLVVGHGPGPRATGDDAVGEMLFAFVIATALGIWIGGVLGCWLGLRLRHHEGAGPTAALVALIGPLWVFATGGFVDSQRFLSGLGPLTTAAGGILNFLVLAVAPLVARAIVVWLRSEPPAQR